MKRLYIVILSFSLVSCMTIEERENRIIMNRNQSINKQINSSDIVRYSPDWVELNERTTLLYDRKFNDGKNGIFLSNGAIISKSDFTILEEFCNYFGNSYDILLRIISRFNPKYDKINDYIIFDSSDDTALHSSYISIRGLLRRGTINSSMKFQYYGEKWIFANRIIILIDGKRYDLNDLKFYRDNTTIVWEYTFFYIESPLSKEIIQSIGKSQETIIRFQGEQYYFDLLVSSDMKNEIQYYTQVMESIR